jgi:hypothetical protein
MYYQHLLRNLCISGVLAAIAMSISAFASAETLKLPVSPKCVKATVPAGTWYAVEGPRSLKIRALKRFYRHTVGHRGNVFGSDYCTFERYLVYANPIAAHGGAVDAEMNNLASSLLLPVAPEAARNEKIWICFRPNLESDPACPAKPGLAKGAVLPNGVQLWTEQGAALQPLPPADRKSELERGPLPRDMPTGDARGANDQAIAALKSEIAQLTAAVAEMKTALANQRAQPSPLSENAQRSVADMASGDSWGWTISITALILAAIAAIVAIIALAHANSVPPEEEAHRDHGYEPGDSIKYEVPEGLTAAGSILKKEIIFKTRTLRPKRNEDQFDYWVLTEHARVELGADESAPLSDEVLEKMFQQPHRYLVRLRKLASHLKTCQQCQSALGEQSPAKERA